MAKVVVLKLADAKNRKAATKSASVGEKRVRDAAGQVRTVRTLDGQSETFGTDLTYVFARNVARARRENKQVTGAVDRIPAKA